MSYKMLYITENPEPFLSSWGVYFTCQPHEDGFICPLGWEQELAARGIAFEVIEIPIEQPSNDGVAWEGIEEPTSTNEP